MRDRTRLRSVTLLHISSRHCQMTRRGNLLAPGWALRCMSGFSAPRLGCNLELLRHLHLIYSLASNTFLSRRLGLTVLFEGSRKTRHGHGESRRTWGPRLGHQSWPRLSRCGSLPAQVCPGQRLNGINRHGKIPTHWWNGQLCVGKTFHQY